MERIVEVSANKLQFKIDAEASKEIARRARGTPRVANRLLRRIRDFAEVRGDGVGELEIAQAALELLGVDSMGLDPLDTQYLKTLIDKFDGLAGLETMSAALGEESGTLEDVVEPFLIQRGFISKTARGRAVTEHALRHFHREMPIRDGDLYKPSNPNN